MLRLGLHGGLNCGIKHIYGFNDYAFDCIQPALIKKTPNYRDKDGDGFSVGNFCSDGQGETNLLYYREAPEETTLLRLDRYLQFLEGNRPGGIVEVTLNGLQIKKWEEILLERGFTCVSSAMNSNSDNNIYVFHKIMVEE